MPAANDSIRRKLGTDMNFRRAFAGNSLSVPGLPTERKLPKEEFHA
jgi:hypothetical protein